MKPRTRFLISAATTFGLMSLTLWLLGPVWILDFQENSVVALVVVLLILAVLTGIGSDAASPAGDLASAAIEATVQVTVGGGRLLKRLSGRFWPAALGFLAGGVLAIGLGFGLSQTEAARMTYARAKPEQALASDYVAMAPAFDQHKKIHKKPPEDMTQLVGTLRQSGFSPRFSVFRGDVWEDAWGSPLRYRAKKRLIGWKTELYSVGPDRVDNDGGGDDVSADGILRKWKVMQILLGPTESDK